MAKGRERAKPSQVQEDVYLIQAEKGHEYLAYGPNKLIQTMKLLEACGVTISHFFIRWAGHKPEDMGIFPDE